MTHNDRKEEYMVKVETTHVRYQIDENGRNTELVFLSTGANWCVQGSPAAWIRKEGREYPASAAEKRQGKIHLQFGDSGVKAALALHPHSEYFIVSVESVIGNDVEEFRFLDIPTIPPPDKSYTCSALALNLMTRVEGFPGMDAPLQASCYGRFGFTGAAVAIAVCPRSELGRILREVVSSAPDLPHSPLGGPWAIEAPATRGSYLFNFGGVTEETVDDWIGLLKAIGFTQFDFHGGSSFRFGDCRPNPEMYPKGRDSLKAVIDRLHGAGIMAGLHTYAHFIDKSCQWVTPVPDSRLAKEDRSFTLATSLNADDTDIQVNEPTEGVSATTGFQVRNSSTLQVDNELITYSGVIQEVPYRFTGCKRGACGTRVTVHSTGAKVYHLKECFGLFCPDGNSTLLEEVAAATADMFNECGFDMIYLDALDGEDVLGGSEWGWHYGSKFVFEIWKHLKRPALMESSAFHHHLWYVRSRTGAWDHAMRAHKRQIDEHCVENQRTEKMLLPGHLGWWSILNWSGANKRRTFLDDVEYLCAKSLGTNTGFSLMGIAPGSLRDNSFVRKVAPMIGTYERLRHSGCVPESVKQQLRVPWREFTLVESPSGGIAFRPVKYIQHKIHAPEPEYTRWRVRNDYAAQPLCLRIEALMSTGSGPETVPLADGSSIETFTDRVCAPCVSSDLQLSNERTPDGLPALEFRALNSGADPRSAWVMMRRFFHPPISLIKRPGDILVQGQAMIEEKKSDKREAGLGLWVFGDGKGETLNIRLRSPIAVNQAISDHYIVIDFNGWRYFELLEQEDEHFFDYQWPDDLPGGFYLHGLPNRMDVYRESVDPGRVHSFSFMYNNLPRDQHVSCLVGPVKALPLVSTKVVNPAVTVSGKTVTFPVDIESGCYLEFNFRDDCLMYGRDGNIICSVVPEGAIPALKQGENDILFACELRHPVRPRAWVTVKCLGEQTPDMQVSPPTEEKGNAYAGR